MAKACPGQMSRVNNEWKKAWGSKRPQLVKIESSKAYSEHKKLKSKREQLVRIQIQIQSSRSTKDYGRKFTTPFWTTQENQMAPSFLPLTSFDSLGIQFLHKEESTTSITNPKPYLP